VKKRASSTSGRGRKRARNVILTYSIGGKVQTRQLPPPLARRAHLVLRQVIDSYALPETDGDAGLYFPAVEPGRSIFGPR
jgi:hypothetical protein